MKIVFFGTPDYVVPIVETLHKAYKSKSGESPIAAVVTQSPKPVGRKQTIEYSAVDHWAHKKGIKIFFKPGDIISNKIKADVGILASYGAIIPKEVMNYFAHGILVIHPSLLPEFRWASPVPGALVAGTNPTGLTIIKMDDKFDHGPIVAQYKESVSDADTYGSLRDRLFAKSADILVGLLPAYTTGKITLKPQDGSKASFARMLTKEDAYIPPAYLDAALKGKAAESDWKIPFITINKSQYITKPTTANLFNFIRAMIPWPCAWTSVRISEADNQPKRLKILSAHLETERLILDEVQLEGKNEVSWKQFSEAYPNLTFGS